MRNLRSFSCPGDPESRNSRSRVRQDPWPKPRFRLTGHAPKRWALPGSQLPGRNPVLPDPSEAEAPSEPVAARLPEGTAFCRAGPGSEDPVSRLTGPHLARRPSGDRVGAVRNLPLSHTLKGKPVLVRYAAASSAALPSASARGVPSENVLPSVCLGCGWEGSPPLPEVRLGHTRKLSRFIESTKRIPPVDNEDNGHKSRSPEPAHAPLAPRAPPE